MKRLAVVLAICMLLPLNAFALQPLNDDNMGEITGQAGVSIAIDDVKLIQHINDLVYTDIDGADGTGSLAGGSIGIDNLAVTVNINAITTLTGAGLPYSPGRASQGDYTGIAANSFFNAAGDTIFQAKALTIDAGTLAVLSEGMSYNMAGAPTGVNITGVRIGLPTVEIVQSEMTFDVIATSTGAANSGASYGTIQIGQVTMAVLDGFVEIAPH